MSETIIRELAEQIFREQILTNWHFYAVLIAISFVGSVFTTGLTAYVKRRAETYATKADLDCLIEQLQLTTMAAEEVKTAISHSDWAARQWKTLRRTKLEELLTTAEEVQNWLDKEMDHYIFGEKLIRDTSPLSRLETIGILYFSELEEESRQAVSAARRYRQFILGTGRQLIRVRDDIEKREDIFEAIWEPLAAHQQSLNNALSDLQESASKLMRELVS